MKTTVRTKYCRTRREKRTRKRLLSEEEEEGCANRREAPAITEKREELHRTIPRANG